jgi:hypothetical protein
VINDGIGEVSKDTVGKLMDGKTNARSDAEEEMAW